VGPHFALRAPDRVAKLVRGLHPELKRKIRQALRNVLDNPSIGKALKEELEGLRSYRVRGFRVVYQVVAAKREVRIVAIGPRESIYRETYRLLKRKAEPERKSADRKVDG
jgi:mRNA interferase RelE/StbE